MVKSNDYESSGSKRTGFEAVDFIGKTSRLTEAERKLAQASHDAYTADPGDQRTQHKISALAKLLKLFSSDES